MISREEYFDLDKQRDRAEVYKALKARKKAAADEFRSSKEEYEAFDSDNQPPLYWSLEGWPVADLPIEQLAQRSVALYYETDWLHRVITKCVSDAWDRDETAEWFTVGWKNPGQHVEIRPSIKELEGRRRALWGKLEHVVSACVTLEDVGVIDHADRSSGQRDAVYTLLTERLVEVRKAYDEARRTVIREVESRFADPVIVTGRDENGVITSYFDVMARDTHRVDFIEWPEPATPRTPASVE